ncbi:hypothetical protein BJ912DRAFT_1144298 [Pholiota molesta]|nr:hypothetical protein BJ912DRAFT_1144298 [Pholiota molesta]
MWAFEYYLGREEVRVVQGTGDTQDCCRCCCLPHPVLVFTAPNSPSLGVPSNSESGPLRDVVGFVGEERLMNGTLFEFCVMPRAVRYGSWRHLGQP